MKTKNYKIVTAGSERIRKGDFAYYHTSWNWLDPRLHSARLPCPVWSRSLKPWRGVMKWVSIGDFSYIIIVITVPLEVARRMRDSAKCIWNSINYKGSKFTLTFSCFNSLLQRLATDWVLSFTIHSSMEEMCESVVHQDNRETKLSLHAPRRWSCLQHFIVKYNSWEWIRLTPWPRCNSLVAVPSHSLGFHKSVTANVLYKSSPPRLVRWLSKTRIGCDGLIR